MKKFLKGSDLVAIELVPNPDMAVLHTTFDLHVLRKALTERGTSIEAELNALYGIEGTNKYGGRARYNLSIDVGRAFDREQVAETAARVLLELTGTDPSASISLLDENQDSPSPQAEAAA